MFVYIVMAWLQVSLTKIRARSAQQMLELELTFVKSIINNVQAETSGFLCSSNFLTFSCANVANTFNKIKQKSGAKTVRGRNVT